MAPILKHREILWVLVISILVRFLLNAGTPLVAAPDSFGYLAAADSIRANLDFETHEIQRTPGYSAVLAVLATLSPEQNLPRVLGIFQHLLAIASILLTYRLARRFFTSSLVIGVAGAAGAALLVGIHPFLLIAERMLLTEILFLPLLLLIIDRAVAATDRFREGEDSLRGPPPGAGSFLVVAFLGALLTLVRPLAQLFAPMVLVIMAMPLFMTPNARVRRSAAVQLVLGLILYGALLVPWCLVNQRSYGFFGLSKDSGLNLFHKVVDVAQIDPQATSKYPRVQSAALRARDARGSATYFRTLRILKIEGMSAYIADERMKRFSLELMRSHPTTFALSTIHSGLELLFFPEVNLMLHGTTLVAHDLPQTAPPWTQSLAPRSKRAAKAVTTYLRWSAPVFRVLPVVFALGLIFVVAIKVVQRFGVSATRHPRPDILGLLRIVTTSPCFVPLLTIAYFTAITALTNRGEDRFRLPIEPLLMIGVSWALVTAAVRVRAIRAPKARLPHLIRGERQ